MDTTRKGRTNLPLVLALLVAGLFYGFEVLRAQSATGIGGLEQDPLTVSKTLQFRSVTTDQTDLSRPAVYYSSTTKQFRLAQTIDMFGGITSPIGQTVADSGTLTNPTSNTSFAQVITVSAAALAAGKTLRVYAGGKLTMGTAGTVTFTLMNGDSTALLTTAAVTPTLVANSAWDLGVRFVPRTVGASGTYAARSMLTVTSVSQTTDGGVTAVTRTTGSIDTTAAIPVRIGILFGTSNASNVATMEDFAIETCN